ncbi:MAG TPA: hypothetical protein VGJ49_08230 [Gaiellaceae bacterium]|jgi:hypothetical protein
MRYMSRWSLAFVTVVGPLVSVLVSFALSLSADRNYLPIGINPGEEPLALVFLFLPLGITVAVGRRHGRSSAAIAGASLATFFLTIVLAWIFWIGWIYVVCEVQNNRCFD